MSAPQVLFVCPRCKGPLDTVPGEYVCPACASSYPVICGIADFRLKPDPYISIPDDRRKGELLFREGATRSFEGLLRYYYTITPDDPPDLAERWTAHALMAAALARTGLQDAGLIPPPTGHSGALLDVGCSTGALLVAAADSYGPTVGVDVAFRWLVVGQVRLREAGKPATLVCANAEHLPFADQQFHAVTFTDVLEHVSDPGAAVREAYRVSAPGVATLCTNNNRFALGPEPNVRLPIVGYLPRRWQAAWVARRRGDLHPYRVVLRSAREFDRWFQSAGYREVRTEPGLLAAPHVPSATLQRLLGLYNAVRRLPIARGLLRLIGPRLTTRARR